MKEILETLDLDLNDDSIRDTPMRVAKMYVNELFNGMNTEVFPSMTTFALKDPTEVT
jgi:GTP cyclohydrolase I